MAKIIDGFKNIIKGLGTSKDPRQNTFFIRGLEVTQQIANDIYVFNWLARKVIDIPVEDALRKWILISDADKRDKIERALKTFCVKDVASKCAKWSRLYGGAVIIAIVENQDPEEPLLVESVRPNSLKRFVVLDRYNIYPGILDRNILSDNFGQPEFYQVSREGQRVHHSRVFQMNGQLSTIQESERQNFWGNSILSTILEPITDSQTVSNSISSLIYESNIDVYGIDGLNAAVAEGQDDFVVERLRVAAEMKSIINGIALDKNDEYTNKTKHFAQLPEIDDRFIQKVSGASNIPVTRLLGISPAGQNATGESDMLNYYDFVQAYQENELRPAVDWMNSVIAQSLGLPDEIEYEFRPLKQLTELEEADVGFKNAQRDQIYIENGVIEPIDAEAQLAKNGVYATIDEDRVKQDLAELGFDETES